LPRFVAPLARHPARATFAWYAGGVLVGSILLLQPFSQAAGKAPIKLIDSVFTAASALCVTGLTVRSTGHDFSLLGQALVLLLIQLGGIGIITVTTYVTLRLGARQSLHSRTLLADALGTGDEPDLRAVLRRVVRFTLLFELAGAVALTARLLFVFGFGWTAVWHGVFHSVSAFCNAGFSLNDDSLMRYQGDWFVNLTIMTLIVCGGIGYPVLIDIARNWHGPPRDRWGRLMLHTKLMIVGTALLIVMGAAAVLFLESQYSMRNMSWPQRVLAATFQSVTSRTAGFNTIDTGRLRDATLFVVILLMMVGAGPCSTAGGFKVSTLTVLVLRAWNTFWGSARVHVARRTIPQEVVDRAITTAFLFAVVSIIGLTCLLSIEHFQYSGAASGELFLDGTFEVASGLATVGLSTGLTPNLATTGKMIIIALMFIGRLGPITVAAAVSRSRREPAIVYASEEPLVG
jgi:trk system potassium uptake protein TrkH